MATVSEFSYRCTDYELALTALVTDIVRFDVVTFLTSHFLWKKIQKKKKTKHGLDEHKWVSNPMDILFQAFVSKNPLLILIRDPL